MITIKKANKLTKKKPSVCCADYFPMLEGTVTMLYAGGGVGKSFASIKQSMYFVKETGRSVALWLSEDSEGENRNRYERLLADFGATPRKVFDDRIDFITDVPQKITVLKDGNAILTEDFTEMQIALLDYGMIVLDPLLQFQGGDENNNTHAGVFMGGMKDWAESEKKCVLLLHHASKNKEGQYRARGAGEWVNGTRATYLLDYQEGDQDYRTFKLKKDNGVGYHFMDMQTKLMERKMKVFPKFSEADQIPPRHRVRMSFAAHSNLKNPMGYEPREVNFEVLHNMAKEYSYSQFQFNEGHRLSSKNLGFSDVIIIDYDDGVTLLEAEKKFAGYQALVITTKRHQKEGYGDRFRVFLRLSEPYMIDSSTFRATMQAVFDHFGGGADEAANDLARVFMPSPPDAFHYYIKGDKCFDVGSMERSVAISKKRDALQLEKRKKSEAKYGRNNGALLPNELSADFMFTTRNGERSFSSIASGLSVGQKESVLCHHGKTHNGSHGADKSNLAGFISRVDYERVKYQCVVCKEEALWLPKVY